MVVVTSPAVQPGRMDPRMGPRPGEKGHERLDETLAFLHTSFFAAFSPLWQAFEGAEGAEKEVLTSVGRRKVKKVYRRLQENPAVRFAQAIEHGEEARGAGAFLGHISLEAALETLR